MESLLVQESEFSMPRQSHRQNLNVYLLKDCVNSFDGALLKPTEWKGKAIPLDLGKGTQAQLYLRLQNGGVPKWMEFLQGGLPTGAHNPFSRYKKASAGALVILKIDASVIQSESKLHGFSLPKKSRWFAITYGYGRAFLANVWEPRFGFHIALNVAEQSGFRQVDFEQYRGQSIQRQVSSSGLSSLGILGFDSEQDLIRRIVAKLDDSKKSFAFRVAGRDNVAITCDLAINTVPNKCIELLVQSSKKDYQKKFPEVESIIEVRDPFIITKLDALLLQQLISNNLAKIHFAPPEVVSYDDDFNGFTYGVSSNGNPEEEISFNGFLAHSGKGASLTVAALKSQRVLAIRSDGSQKAGPWPFYNTIVAEVTDAGRLYVLMAGEWYEFENNYVLELDRYVNALPLSTYLAAHVRNGETSEDRYLMNLKTRRGIGFIVAHKELVSFGGGRNKVEVCDLLQIGTGNRRSVLIHIKGGGGGSETGHLVHQASNSLELMIDEDPAFRTAALAKLQNQSGVNGVALPSSFPASGNQYAIVYAIFVRGPVSVSDGLTLFGKIALRRAVRTLKKFGCEVSLELMRP